MKGYISSFQSLGTVDGPGLRSVVFMQGCPLKCACCHNPETQPFTGGTEVDSAELAKKILRFRSYYGTRGGLTVSGGEPLMQAEFVTELFRQMKNAGINTALDTSGCRPLGQCGELWKYTDLILLDYKFSSDEDYEKYAGGSREAPLGFLAEAEEKGIPVWLRRVIIPGINDDEGSMLDLEDVSRRHDCVKKTELLPFHKLCKEKYENLGIPFRLENTPEPGSELMKTLGEYISKK